LNDDGQNKHDDSQQENSELQISEINIGMGYEEDEQKDQFDNNDEQDQSDGDDVQGEMENMLSAGIIRGNLSSTLK